MPVTAVITKKIVVNGRELSSEVTLEAEGGQQVPALTIGAGQTNKEVQMTFAVARVNYFYARASQTVTIKSNNSGAPDDTLVLPAGSPYMWDENDPGDFAFGTDVTKLYVTNAGEVDAVLDIEVGYDATP